MSVSGDLNEFGVAELLQVLNISRKTGVLALQGGGVSGALTLAQGRLVDARLKDGPEGEEAFFALVGMLEGRFLFRGTEELAGMRTISRPLEALLLEAGLPPRP